MVKVKHTVHAQDYYSPDCRDPKTFSCFSVIRNAESDVGEFYLVDGDASRELFPVQIIRRNGHEQVEILHVEVARWQTLRKIFIEKDIKGRVREEGSRSSFVFALGEPFEI